MTLQQKVKLRNELREWAFSLGIFFLIFGGYILAEYWDAFIAA